MNAVHLAILFVTSSLGAIACSSTKSCTSAGCSDLVSARLALGRPANELRGGTVRFCVDGDCTTSAIDVAEAGAPASALHCTGGRVHCFAGPTANDLDVSFERQAGTARTGEVFEMTVIAPAGETIASRKGTVEYARVQPNGPECDPTCLQGELK